MLETVTNLISYTPLIIFIATILDVFFITGYIFYGFAMFTTISALLLSGSITIEILLISATLGTVTGNTLNFYIGKKFGSTEYIQNKLQNKHTKKLSNLAGSQKLLIFMTICRFIAVLRPAYALLLGTLNVNIKRFLMYEIIISIIWITFWIVIITKATDIVIKVIH